MEKYGNKSPFMKILHKYTGFITVGIFLAIAIPVFLFTVQNQYFFETWSCGGIQNYLLTYDQDLYNADFPDHEHLSEEEHARLHEIILECNFQKPFEHKFN